MPFPIARLAMTAALACSAAVAVAQSVTPPPLPPGSKLVRPEAGLNQEERKRYVRAHHHKMHNNRDYTHDDSLAPQPGSAPAMRSVGAPAAAAGAAAPVAPAGTSAPAAAPRDLGGAGTGPARAQTGKGASSYFYGQDKK